MNNIILYLTSFVTGGAFLEIIKMLFPDIKSIFQKKIAAKNLFNKHSEPILKSADELFGKIYSLAKEDFKPFIKYDSSEDEMTKIYVLYLFASFWGSLGLLKQATSHINLARIKKGENLLRFVTSYESRSNRILDRSIQRAIGESVIIGEFPNFRIISLYQFSNLYRSNNSMISETLKPLEAILFQTHDKLVRQKILVFGVIIHAMIDYLDKNHKVIRDRDPYVNKLSEKSKKQLETRVFRQYLPFVKNSSKYYTK